MVVCKLLVSFPDPPPKRKGGSGEYSTVRSHLSELQLSEHVGYPNGFNKATPTISGYFRRREAIQMADIECFRARSTCCIAAEDTG